MQKKNIIYAQYTPSSLSKTITATFCIKKIDIYRDIWRKSRSYWKNCVKHAFPRELNYEGFPDLSITPTTINVDVEYPVT